MKAYSWKPQHVIDKLSQGETHVQPWSATAACNPAVPQWYRRTAMPAYFWLFRRLRRRLNLPPRGAPIWVALDRGVLDFKAGYDGERIVHLEIPEEEMLVYMIIPWAEHILRYESSDNDHEGSCLRLVCTCPPEFLGKKWETIFALTGESARHEAVVDRIEPAWLVDVEPLPSESRSVND